ncbi:MAG TPA: penicillin acylase family protein [Longimicrobium sp.]|nr:penicillin acylase family protein [Longimicrobium sp.]
MNRSAPILAALLLAAPVAAEGQRAPAAPAGRAEVLWDRWGVPHVYARDDRALFRAFGWAQMRAHGDLILQLYGESRGRAAEYWGEEELALDRWVRTVGIPERAKEWYAAQTPDFRANLDAFAEGMNAWAAANPDSITPEVRVVLPVTPVDVLAHVQRVVWFEFLTSRAAVAGEARRLTPGSNGWAVARGGRPGRQGALLLANPHLPWSGLHRMFEAQLTAPGVDVYGAALVGFPVLGFAFNERLGWTHTVNTLDGADLFALELAEGGYRWDGAVRAFETARQVVRVRRADGTLRDDTLTVRRSVHGPVVAEAGGRALALRVAALDRPGLVAQYWEMGRARSLGEFETALRRMQVPLFTVVYADREGHVLSVFNGSVPRRPRGDFAYWSGTVRGDSSATLWSGTLGYDSLPRVLDPPSGWVQNANESPWTATLPLALDPSAFPAYLAPPPGMSLRAQRSARMLSEGAPRGLDDLARAAQSTRVELADRVLDELLAAARAHGGEGARRAAEVLARWDRTTDAASRGAVLFAAWGRALGGSPFARGWSAEAPLATPSGLRDARAAAVALDSAAARVERAHGALDVPWGDVHRVRVDSLDFPASGGPGALGVFRVLEFAPAEGGRQRAVFGDSWMAAVELGPTVRARAILPYGNWSRPRTAHRGDQLRLFAAGEMRPVWRTRAEVEANLASRERP